MINMTARGFELKEHEKETIEKELKRVEKMLPDTTSFDVTITSQIGLYQCDVTVKDAGSFIRGEAVADRVGASVDFAVDDLKRKLRKLKTNLRNKQRKSGIDVLAGAMQGLNTEDVTDNFERNAEVTRSKVLDLKMMTEDEAMVQMEMLGHAFFVYLGEDGNVRVLYHRKKGYGTLECRL